MRIHYLTKYSLKRKPVIWCKTKGWKSASYGWGNVTCVLCQRQSGLIIGLPRKSTNEFIKIGDDGKLR